MLNVSEIRALSPDEINKKIGELRLELFKVRVQQGAMGIEKPHQIKTCKKNIAKLKPVLSEIK